MLVYIALECRCERRVMERVDELIEQGSKLN